MHAKGLTAVLEPIERAAALPNRHYVDPASYAEECERVLFAGWTGLGFASDVAEPGDARAIDLAGQPLLLVRDRAGQVRVFVNACRHRGMQLVPETGETKKLRGMIRCPYHSWVYDLDGRLKATPHVGGPGVNMHEALDRETLGLVELRSRVWQGVVFVNVSGDAEPFETEQADLLARWKDFDRVGHAHGDSKFVLSVAANWKLAVENYCESYHLPWIHPGLNSYSRLEDHYDIVDERYSGQGTNVYAPALSEAGAFANFDDLPAVWDRQAEYVSLYPNVLLGVHRDHRFAIVLLPQGPERTVERIAIEYASEAMVGDRYREARATNAAMWKEIFEEDIFVVEGMQRGRHAQRFDGGRFSPAMDRPTHAFHRWVARRMGAA